MSIDSAASFAPPGVYPTASAMIAEHLRRKIVRNELVDDECLPPEARLMTYFGVSRPTLRQAYRILESENLLAVTRGSNGGARVRKPSPGCAATYAGLVLQAQGAPLSDLFVARFHLEIPIAGKVAEAARENDLAELRAINAEADQCQRDLSKTFELHQRFHRALIKISGNATLLLLVEILDNILDSANSNYARDRRTSGEVRGAKASQQAHTQMLKLLEKKDKEGCVALWRQHLSVTGKHALAHGADCTALRVTG